MADTMDTFAKLRRLERAPPPKLSNDPALNLTIMRGLRNEVINTAWGRAIWFRIAIVGWAVALVSVWFHVF